jgi:hypothetical protein
VDERLRNWVSRWERKGVFDDKSQLFVRTNDSASEPEDDCWVIKITISKSEKANCCCLINWEIGPTALQMLRINSCHIGNYDLIFRKWDFDTGCWWCDNGRQCSQQRNRIRTWGYINRDSILRIDSNRENINSQTTSRGFKTGCWCESLEKSWLLAISSTNTNTIIAGVEKIGGLSSWNSNNVTDQAFTSLQIH